MSKLTACHDYKVRPISLLIIKYIYIATFGLYRSWNPQRQYINYIYNKIQCFSRSRLSNRGLTKQQFILPQLYYIMVKQRTLSNGPSRLLLSSLLLFLLPLKYLDFLFPISTPQLLFILHRVFYSHILYSFQPFYI